MSNFCHGWLSIGVLPLPLWWLSIDVRFLPWMVKHWCVASAVYIFSVYYCCPLHSSRGFRCLFFFIKKTVICFCPWWLSIDVKFLPLVKHWCVASAFMVVKHSNIVLLLSQWLSTMFSFYSRWLSYVASTYMVVKHCYWFAAVLSG